MIKFIVILVSLIDIFISFIQIKEKKYIFLYGGQDNEWIQKFPERVKVLVDQDLIKQKGISIQLLSVSESKGKVDLERFWTNIESCFISNAQGKTQIDVVAREIQKLLSYKNGLCSPKGLAWYW